MSASVQRHGVDPKDVPRPASEACHLAAAAGAPRASCSGPIGARGVLRIPTDHDSSNLQPKDGAHDYPKICDG
jgi:hypothetical protein